jgi:hypothetical protein
VDYWGGGLLSSSARQASRPNVERNYIYIYNVTYTPGVMTSKQALHNQLLLLGINSVNNSHC